MPAFPFTDEEMKLLLAHVHGLAAGEIKAEAERVFFRGGRSLLQPKPGSVKLANGKTVKGTIVN